jgi:hypothetical protein
MEKDIGWNEMTIDWTEENKQQLLKIINQTFLILKNGDLIRRDEMSDELKARAIGVDQLKEIFDLWYEVTYLRYILTEIMQRNPKAIIDPIHEDVFDECRHKAQLFLKDKFKIDLEYSNPKNPNE